MRNRPAILGNFMTPLPFAVGDDQTVEEAHARMTELDIRHLPVMRGSRLVGIVSQRDLASLVASTGRHPSELHVADAMTPDPFVANSEAPVAEIALRMAESRYGAVVVVDGGEVRGIFTTTDALRLLADLLG